MQLIGTIVSISVVFWQSFLSRDCKVGEGVKQFIFYIPSQLGKNIFDEWIRI